ncbi:hypothetical protein [Mesorhizobium sp. M0138]|uniref:hypothetical protein n=1 Tax=Mesorhizobium sp. M0138 TaxID=2956891 RepID=UPI00333AFFBA
MVHITPLSVARRRPGNTAQDTGSSPAGGPSQQPDSYWQEVAEHYERLMAQQQAFDTEIAARKLDGEIAKAEADAVANAPADGAGLHQGMYGEVDPHTGRVLQTGRFGTLFKGFLSRVPPGLHPGLSARKETLRTEGAWRMAAQQLQRRRDYEKAAVGTTLTTNAIAIGKADPDDLVTFETARQQGLDLIDKMGIDPGIRQQMARDWYSTAAKARFEALISRDPKRALAIFGVGTPAAGSGAMGDSAQAAGNSFVEGPRMAPGKEGRVGTQTPDERIAQAFRDDLPQEEQDVLALKAKVAKFSQDIQTRIAIGRAEAEAPDQFARTGAYSGGIPGKDAYRIIYGLDEGDRRRRVLEWRAGVGKKIFDMGTMSNQAIDAAVVSAEPGPNASPEDQERYEITDAAAKLVRERRRVGAGGYVSGLSPKTFEGWEAVFGSGASNPGNYDPNLYDQTIALSVALQKVLGIEDENLQPITFSYLLELAEQRDSGSAYLMDRYAKASELFARTKDPVARAALVRELDEAGLGGILPGGKPGLSAGEVFRADAKALGKAGANAGIFAGKLTKGVGYGLSFGSIDPPDFSQGYYEPANPTEKVMMRQGGDAFGWAIPVPGFGRAAEKGIPRAVESMSAIAAERAEGLVAKRPGELADEGEALVGGVDAQTLRYQQGLASFAFQSVPKSDRAFDNAMLGAMLARDPDKVRYSGAKLGVAESEDYRKIFYARNPKLKSSDNVVHHAGERQVVERDPRITNIEEINSYENLRGIPKKRDRNLHKKVIRFEWDEFYKRNPNFTREQWLDKITEIDKKYGHLFDPPIGE